MIESKQDLIKLGEINNRIAPLQISVEGLKFLGFEVAATDKNARLYKEADFQAMCTAIIKHINIVKEGE